MHSHTENGLDRSLLGRDELLNFMGQGACRPVAPYGRLWRAAASYGIMLLKESKPEGFDLLMCLKNRSLEALIFGLADWFVQMVWKTSTASYKLDALRGRRIKNRTHIFVHSNS